MHQRIDSSLSLSRRSLHHVRCSYFVEKPLTISAISCKVFRFLSPRPVSLLRSHQAWKLRWLSSNYFQQLFASAASRRQTSVQIALQDTHTDTHTDTTSIRRLSWCLCNKRQQQQQLRRRMRNCCCAFERDERAEAGSEGVGVHEDCCNITRWQLY